MNYKVGDIIYVFDDTYVKIVGVTPKTYKVVPLKHNIIRTIEHTNIDSKGHYVVYATTTKYIVNLNDEDTSGRFSKKSIKKDPLYTKYNGGILSKYHDHGN
jgi:hypothetical protein